MTPPFKYLVVDGKLVPYDDARLHILTPAVKYAATAFDGLKAFWSEAQEQLILFRCRDHLTRLLQSARLMGMEESTIPWTSLRAFYWISCMPTRCGRPYTSGPACS